MNTIRWSLGLLGLLLLGCARPAGVVFPPLADAPRWPAAPEPTRVAWVGQLATEADLKPAVPFGQALGKVLFGAKPIQAMTTPLATCTDGANRLFVADSNANVVHVFNLDNRHYAQWVPDTPTKRFAQPVGLAWDPAGSRLYVADSSAGTVIVFDTSGKPVATLGQGVLRRPCGLCWDARAGRLIVVDSGAHEVVLMAPDGALQQRIGGRGMALGQFNYPTYAALDSQGRLYISDSLNFRVQQFSPDFKPIRQIGRQGDMPGYFAQPKGLAVDGEDHLYVVDARFEAVQIFDAEGTLLLTFGEEGHAPGQFWLPNGIFIDHNNRLWVADSYNRRVQVFDYRPGGAP